MSRMTLLRILIVTSRKAAETAHVPPEQLAKAVVLSDRRGFLMAVVPATGMSVSTISGSGSARLSLTPETRLAPVFRDCESGAIPPLGQRTAWRPSWTTAWSVSRSLFESGDHRGLIRVGGEEFLALLPEAMHGSSLTECCHPQRCLASRRRASGSSL